MKGKIICVGMHKTGISSLEQALRVLGFTVRGGSSRLLVPILKGNFKPVLKTMESWDAVRDIPWYKIYRELDERVPDCKFILTVREDEAWYRSVSRSIGEIKRANGEWVYGRGKGLPKYNKENTLHVYHKHNREVLEYFEDRPNDLLVLNIAAGDGWDKLCEFFGKEIPEIPFPHKNQASEGVDTSTAHWRFWRAPIKQLKNNFKIWTIDIRGL